MITVFGFEQDECARIACASAETGRPLVCALLHSPTGPTALPSRWKSTHRRMIEQAPQTTRVSSEGRRPIVVLLVDDQRFVGAAVGQLLAAEPDIELHCCIKAVDAIAMANQIVPTMVLQDLVMPDIDGLTLVRLFRENAQTAGTPVIVLSGNDDAATRTRALAEGAADYLVKLPPKADLIACIRRHALRDGDGIAASARSPAASLPQAPVNNETLDRDTIGAFLEMGSPDFVRSLIDRFTQEAGSQVRTLRDAAERQDRAALTATAHALKGSSGIMGARRLAALCAQVEAQLAGTAGGVVTPALMTDIDLELVHVRDALATVRQGNDQR
jgi:DNA-binding NarL/FixJ family response regulator